jgi:predicted MFS family arabinose efflux permease
MTAALTATPLMGLIVAASLASTIGGLPFNALPLLLGSLADSFGLSAQAVGDIGSVCFAGYLLGTLGAPFWMNRLNWRLLTVVSALGTAGAFAASSQLQSVQGLYAVWALIGFFASTMTCLGMRVLADLPDKERAYGIRQGVELSVTAAALFALPPLVIAHFQYPGAALALAALILLLALSAFRVPPHSLNRDTTGAVPAPGTIAPAAWLALAVFCLFLAGNIGLWAFLERIGVQTQVAPAQMGLVFAVLKLLGGVAAFSVALFGHRLAPQRAYSLILVAIAAGLLLLAGRHGFLGYALGAWLWEFAFTCGCVYQTAHIARSDPGGRAIVLVPAAFALASMVGPAVAGRLLAPESFTGLLVFALASSAVPVLMGRWNRTPRARVQAA